MNASHAHPDTFAQSFTPSWAVTCWCDDAHVYVMIPATNAPPLIQKYPLTEGGLSKAINILRVQRQALGHGRVHKPSSPPVKRDSDLKPLTDRDRGKVLAAMKKAGIVR